MVGQTPFRVTHQDFQLTRLFQHIRHILSAWVCSEVEPTSIVWKAIILTTRLWTFVMLLMIPWPHWGD